MFPNKLIIVVRIKKNTNKYNNEVKYKILPKNEKSIFIKKRAWFV